MTAPIFLAHVPLDVHFHCTFTVQIFFHLTPSDAQDTYTLSLNGLLKS